MTLTDKEIRAAGPRDGRLTKLSDSHGLQLWAHPSGAKSWHLVYRFGGRQRSMTLGNYPALSLREARHAAAAARARAAAGDDPGPRAGEAAAASAAPTFGAMKSQWLAREERQARAASTLDRAARLAALCRTLDARPIAAIRPPDVLALLQALETAGKLETARRLRAMISAVFRFAAALGHVDGDPAALLSRAIASPRSTPRAALVDADGFAGLLRAIDAYRAKSCVREALLLLALTAARPGELRLAEWSTGEIDLDAGVWTVPAARMKMRLPHRAPLARQSIDLLKKLRGDVGQPPASLFVFPSPRPGRPLSENAFNCALRAMGFPGETATAHGFRASFSTLANQSGLWSYDAIERALAHQEGSEVRRAYHRADYFEERGRLMQWWADEVERMIKLKFSDRVPAVRIVQ